MNDMTEEEMWKAIVDCDASYDGIFYYGVKTTKIYCRPSCKSKTPKRENIVFFHSKEEAEKAGFRPCRRCKPSREDVARVAFISPIGTLCVNASPDGILRVEICHEEEKLPLNSDDSSNPNGKAKELAEACEKELEEYFEGKRKAFDLPLAPKGTEFQKSVWNELLKIPYGETRTYGQITALVGRPKASRAVGMANHANSLLILIPCHRVIGAYGSLTGYAEGTDVKKFLLDLEKEHSAQ